VTATFQQSLEQGSKACISEAYQIAVGHYRAALTLLAKHSDLQVFCQFIMEINKRWTEHCQLMVVLCYVRNFSSCEITLTFYQYVLGWCFIVLNIELCIDTVFCSSIEAVISSGEFAMLRHLLWLLYEKPKCFVSVWKSSAGCSTVCCWCVRIQLGFYEGTAGLTLLLITLCSGWWPLVWKTWKCQGFRQLSGKCQGFY